MNTTSMRILELLLERIRLMEMLSDSLDAAGLFIASNKIDALEIRIAEQQRLCTLLEATHQEFRSLLRQENAATSLDMPDSCQSSLPCGERDLREIVARLRLAENRLRASNASQSARVRRSRKTVTALLNAMQTFQGTYQNSALAQNAAKSEMRGRA